MVMSEGKWLRCDWDSRIKSCLGIYKKYNRSKNRGQTIERMGPQRKHHRSNKKQMANSKPENERTRKSEREKNNERDCVCTAKARAWGKCTHFQKKCVYSGAQFTHIALGECCIYTVFCLAFGFLVVVLFASTSNIVLLTFGKSLRFGIDTSVRQCQCLCAYMYTISNKRQAIKCTKQR